MLPFGVSLRAPVARHSSSPDWFFGSNRRSISICISFSLLVASAKCQRRDSRNTRRRTPLMRVQSARQNIRRGHPQFLDTASRIHNGISACRRHFSAAITSRAVGHRAWLKKTLVQILLWIRKPVFGSSLNSFFVTCSHVVAIPVRHAMARPCQANRLTRG